MLNPSWVSSARDDVQRPLAFGNHTCALGVEEGRTRPGHALRLHSRHVSPLIRPETAKLASSQGGALALDGREHTSLKFKLKIMKRSYLHD
jgi:hypothetical protein